MRLAAHQQSLIEELMHLGDPQERLAAVVDRARRAPRFSPEERHPADRVAGCSSSAWLTSRFHDGRCYFKSDADSPVVRGLVVLLADFFSDAKPVEIVATEIDPLEALDLTRMLTPTRRHGLAAVRTAIRAFAQTQLNPRDSVAAKGGCAGNPG